MCGIAGFIDQSAQLDAPVDTLRSMACAISHRGPDDQGVWFDPETGVGLSHARLAVIDPTPAGRQPMSSRSGRLVLTYNGEIYNASSIRSELERAGIRFKGTSDTEVLLEGIEHYGLEEMLGRCVGMFAFACWDIPGRTMHLVRDRFGIKPLYIRRSGGSLVFASELKGIFQACAHDMALDRDAIQGFLQRGYVPGPRSIISSIEKLQPGHILSIRHLGDELETGETEYWSPIQHAINSSDDPMEGSAEDKVDAIESMLRTSVEQRLVSDVPLGAFLSGGIDSSIIAMMMQEVSTSSIRTFSLGSSDKATDERHHARRIAEHLGTEHAELEVTASDCLEVIPSLPSIYDEPFADSSQIPVFLLSRFCRNEVTVALSGDGGDEVFGGYNRYSAGFAAWQKFKRTPRPLRSAMQSCIRRVPPSTWNRMQESLARVRGSRSRTMCFGDRMHKLAAQLSFDQVDEYYGGLTHAWGDQVPMRGAHPTATALELLPGNLGFSSVEQMMLADTCSYLVDDILTKVDRASMSVALEVRVPFLDHRLYELAWRLPLALRVDGRRGKTALRAILARRLPPALFDRPKVGFAIPLDDWLRGALRDWAESLLERDGLEDLGLDADPILHTWQEHLSGRFNHQTRLWPVLVLKAWHMHWRDTLE